MKKIIFFAFLLIATMGVKGQDTSKKNQPIVLSLIKADPTPADLERIPRFPGTQAEFNQYTDEHAERLLKPNHANGIVVVKATIDRQGKVASAVIVRSLSAETDSAAIYLLKNGPTWQPGHDKGVAISATIYVGVKFHDPKHAEVARVPPTVLSKTANAEVTIDEPVKPGEAPSDKIYTAVEQQPQFPGGVSAFYKFINDNNRLKGKDTDMKGRVIVNFTVEKDGSLTEIKIIRGISPEFDAEALRIMKLSPKWQPGVQNGNPVRVSYSVPVVLLQNK